MGCFCLEIRSIGVRSYRLETIEKVAREPRGMASSVATKKVSGFGTRLHRSCRCLAVERNHSNGQLTARKTRGSLVCELLGPLLGAGQIAVHTVSFVDIVGAMEMQS